jgi:hypothetical protein
LTPRVPLASVTPCRTRRSSWRVTVSAQTAILLRMSAGHITRPPVFLNSCSYTRAATRVLLLSFSGPNGLSAHSRTGIGLLDGWLGELCGVPSARRQNYDAIAFDVAEFSEPLKKAEGSRRIPS